MVNWDEPSHKLDWLAKLVEANWDTATAEERKNIVSKLKIAVSELFNVSITQETLTDLIQLTDLGLLWETLLDLRLHETVPTDDNGFRFYLKKVLINKWRARQPRFRVWQPRVPPADDGGLPPAPWEVVNRVNPLNFSKHCPICGDELRSDNESGKCYKCSQNGVTKRKRGRPRKTQ
jgi:hypothetical protein